MRQIVVVGASLAGLRAAEELRRAGFAGELIIIGEEPHQPYDRPPLSKAFMASRVEREKLALRQSSRLAAQWMLGRRAVQVDDDTKTLTLDDGSILPYDGLVIATGSIPRQLASVPISTPGVHMLRTVDDALSLRSELPHSSNIAIVGGGFIGSELASTCRELGLAVTIVTPLPLLATALGPLADAATTRARKHGVRVIERSVVGVRTAERVTGLLLDGGTTLDADVVVVAVGAVPRTDWLANSKAIVDDGVVCDGTLAVTGLRDAVAAGDVARWPYPPLNGELLRVEHWTTTVEQAAAAAKRLLLGTGPAFAQVPSFWSDQFGIRLQGVGIPSLADDVTVVEGDPAGDRFIAEYRRDGELVAAVSAGSATALLPYRRELAWHEVTAAS